MTTSYIWQSLVLLTIVPMSLWNWLSNSLSRIEYQLELQPTNFITCPPEQVSSSYSYRPYLQIKFSPIVINFRRHISSWLAAHAATYSTLVILSATHNSFTFIHEPILEPRLKKYVEVLFRWGILSAQYEYVLSLRSTFKLQEDKLSTHQNGLWR